MFYETCDICGLVIQRGQLKETVHLELRNGAHTTVDRYDAHEMCFQEVRVSLAVVLGQIPKGFIRAALLGGKDT